MEVKVLIIGLTTLLCLALALFTHYPVWNLFFVWTLILLAGTLARWGFVLYRQKHPLLPQLNPLTLVYEETVEPEFVHWFSRAWDIFQTFVFITFTRLFFRSGSNLDPALANEQAWNTAKNMVNQIGSAWDLSLVPAMAWQHRTVLLLFVAGMIIHWLPERFKRRYRIVFARLPLGWMAVVVVIIVVFFFQFITADLQSFIYFQF